MAARFRIDQVTPGTGVDDQSRHDLISGEVITLTATSPVGAGITYEWEIIDKVGTAAVLLQATGTTVQIGAPSQRPFGFLIELRAISGGNVVGTGRRLATGRTVARNLRVPLFAETASPSSTINDPHVGDSTDNASYANLAGRGGAGQNYRGWAELLWELTTTVEGITAAANASDVINDSGVAGANVADALDQLEGDITTLEGDVTTLGGIVNAHTVSLANKVEIGGDLGGTILLPTVSKIQGVVISGAAAANKVLKASGPAAASWENAAGGGPSSFCRNTTISTPGTEVEVGGVYFDPANFLTLTVKLAIVGTYYSTDGASSMQLRLYDMGPGGAFTPVLRATATIPYASVGNYVRVTTTLTFSGSPGVNIGQIHNTTRIYRAVLYLNSSSVPGLYANLLSGGFEIT